MLKEYLKQEGLSIYAIARDSGLPYSTVNDLVNGKVHIDQCRVGLLRGLAEALGLPLEDAYELCAEKPKDLHTSYQVDVRVRVRNKSYLAEFEYGGETTVIELCRVNDETRFYIDEIARWRAEEYIRERRMREFR